MHSKEWNMTRKIERLRRVHLIILELINSSFKDISIFVGGKAGRTREIRRPTETIKQLDNRTIVASPIEYDTPFGEVKSLFNHLRSLPYNRL